jgi:two-component system chemotaxis response regulator CheY
VKLLVVDDSLVVRNAIVRNAASSAIAEVVRAEDGEQAVALFDALRPELVTMDLTMPKLDGLAAISAIQAIEPRTSILVVSALNSQRAAVDAIRRGACGFLTKPFTDRELSDALVQLLDHAERHSR